MNASSETPTGVTCGGACPQRAFTFSSPLCALIPIAVACGTAAVWVPAAASWFTFALRAIAQAGETPPVEVARHLELLVRAQEYSNATLVGASLATLLYSARMVLRRFNQQCSSVSLIHEILAFIGALLGGGMLAAIAYFAFRCQPLGSQDLVLAAGIHSGMWGGLGAMQGRGEDPLRARASTVLLLIAVGMLWGALFILTIVMFWPSAHIERLLFTDSNLVGCWAGGGCACLLCTSVFLNRDARRPFEPPATIAIDERFAEKG